MKKIWILGYFAIVIATLGFAASKMIAVDPFFHFHLPDTDAYYYDLAIKNERSQNDGISRQYDYEGLITGTSMAECFKVSEAKDIFGVQFIKVPFSGASFNEINRSIASAAGHNQKLKYVIRGLDMNKFFEDKDLWRTDLGTFPKYLYDDNWFNDVEYIFNRDVLFSRVYPMTKENDEPDFQGGITSFDEYGNWTKWVVFGHKTVLRNGLTVKEASTPIELSQADIDTIRANIQQNVTAFAEQHPDITFYCFFTPYSVAWWYSLLVDGQLDRQIEAERIVIEEILKCDNIKLFSINCRFDITTDLNNYKDDIHYGEWINSLILRYMHEGKYLLTPDNYLYYLEVERQFYKNYDYTQLINQEDYDYEHDYYAAALLHSEIAGIESYRILENAELIKLSYATIEGDQHNGQDGIVCTGILARPGGSESTLSEYLRDKGYIGAKILLPDVSPYKYLIFYGKKIFDHGSCIVRLYDADGNEIAAYDKKYHLLDKEWHRYIIDISHAEGPCTLILQGGYIDNTGSVYSTYVFSEIALY